MDKCSNCGKEEARHFVVVIDYNDGGFCSTSCMNEFMSELITKQRIDAIEVDSA